MENHPIPQDITGFQFKLIGQMTVKQFGYLATGFIVAWIFYILHIPFLIKAVLVLFSAGLGVSFAFLPVGGRPMDVMFANLLKAIFSPTKFVYQKTGGDIAQTSYSPQPVIGQAQAHVAGQQAEAKLSQPSPPAPEQQMQSQPQAAPNIPAPPAQVPATPSSESPSIQSEAKIEENEQKLEQQTVTLKEELKELKAEPPKDQEALQKAQELERMLKETVLQKQQLENELNMLKSALAQQENAKSKHTAQVAPSQQPQISSQPAADPSGPAKPTETSFPSDAPPNLITGVIKDSRGNPIQNVLVEVKDQEGNPVRAFKTNGLGHFASATSLTNGKYSLSFEDPKEEHRFDQVEIEATGAPLNILEITSIDAREELRRELFN